MRLLQIGDILVAQDLTLPQYQDLQSCHKYMGITHVNPGDHFRVVYPKGRDNMIVEDERGLDWLVINSIEELEKYGFKLL